jgi:hypothetical protein
MISSPFKPRPESRQRSCLEAHRLSSVSSVWSAARSVRRQTSMRQSGLRDGSCVGQLSSVDRASCEAQRQTRSEPTRRRSRSRAPATERISRRGFRRSSTSSRFPIPRETATAARSAHSPAGMEIVSGCWRPGCAAPSGLEDKRGHSVWSDGRVIAPSRRFCCRGSRQTARDHLRSSGLR